MWVRAVLGSLWDKAIGVPNTSGCLRTRCEGLGVLGVPEDEVGGEGRARRWGS